MVASRTSVTAVADEVRGPGSNTDSSPNMSDGPITASRFSRPSGGVPAELHLAGQDHVQPVAELAFGEDGAAARVVDRLQLRSEGERRIRVDPLEDPGLRERFFHPVLLIEPP